VLEQNKIALINALSAINTMPQAEKTEKGNGRSTLKDIAGRAGVSVSTVSLVLAGKAKDRRISGDVIDRVQQVAGAMDYSPNLLIRSLQRGRTHVLSFMNGFRQRSENDLYMDLLSTALERAAGGAHYDVLVCCDFDKSDEDMYRHLNGGRSDGLLFFAPTVDDPLLPYLRASRLPVVLINREDNEGVLSSVIDDTRDGLRQIADAMVEFGHSRVALLANTDWGNPDAHARVSILRDLLLERGIAVPDSWVVSTDDTTAHDAQVAMKFLMEEPQPPTAIFCWHDRLGYQLLEHCSRSGISVPEQVSIFGYDGLHWPSSSQHTLASVCIDMQALADTTIALLNDLIEGKERGLVKIIHPVKLSLGTTVAPPP